MKQTILAATLAAVVFSAMPILAQPAGAADKSSQAKPAAPNSAELITLMVQAQEDMKKMQAQMDRIHQTQDPQVRQKLLREHWATMRNNMRTMEGVWGPGGGMWDCMDDYEMGPDTMMEGGGHRDGYYATLTPAQMKQRQYMMDRYMRMQQMMMEQMMQHLNMRKMR